MTQSFALYRLPHADHYTRIEGQAQKLSSCKDLDGQQGFVVAPFEITEDQPIVLIRPDRVERVALPQSSADPSHVSRLTSHVSPSYHTDFSHFHAQLRQRVFRKIVLARRADESLPEGVSVQDLFMRACANYPRVFVALVHTPQSGTWLTATPEILLEGCGGQWQTMALAGTMKLENEQLAGEGETVRWSTKNIQEQRLVATYIAECLKALHADYREEGPYTVRAANLVHLRSDFSFSLPQGQSVSDLLGRLHPTPAVCGLPKADTYRFITASEHTPRRYYSGFMGPVGEETHLYVSLRCMNIEGDTCRLYAGGGLLKDSVEEQEWLETEAKMETMRRILFSN